MKCFFAEGVFVLVGPLFLDVGLLCAHPLGNPEDPVKGGPQESLLHLLLPPLCGWVLLWHRHDGVLGLLESSHREEQKKILFLFYSLFNPLLNPLVYSVRNAQVKAAFHRVLQKKEDSVREGLVLVQCIFPPSEM